MRNSEQSELRSRPCHRKVIHEAWAVSIGSRIVKHEGSCKHKLVHTITTEYYIYILYSSIIFLLFDAFFEVVILIARYNV